MSQNYWHNKDAYFNKKYFIVTFVDMNGDECVRQSSSSPFATLKGAQRVVDMLQGNGYEDIKIMEFIGEWEEVL